MRSAWHSHYKRRTIQKILSTLAEILLSLETRKGQHLQPSRPIVVLVLAAAGLVACRSARADKAADTCGSFPEWSAETVVKTGDVYRFDGTSYVATGDSFAQNPFAHVALWKAVPCIYTAATALESSIAMQPWKLVWSDEFERRRSRDDLAAPDAR